MGVRRTRWIKRCGVRLGRCVYAERQTHGEYVARRISLAEPKRGWFRGDRAGGKFFTQWLRALRHGRQRVGMDYGLVSGTQGDTGVLLRELQSQGWRTRQKL